jgi:guanosine-3',5'-bis(diphosphate) 3'-pyrophosphohydrolase
LQRVSYFEEIGKSGAMMRQFELVERVMSYDKGADEDLLNRAYVYAMKAHGGQKRASGEAYFNHPLEVAAILAEMKLDGATIAAALLHDVVEDTEATQAQIEEKFGHEIASLVDGLTKIKRLDLVTKEATQAENLRKLLLAMAKDVRVLLVKLADRLHNMRTLGHMAADKKIRIAQETMDIYAPLAGRMGMQNVREELEDIAFRVLNPDAFATVKKRLDRLHEESGSLLVEIEKELKAELAANGIEAKVTGREKRPYSIWRKMERKSLSLGQLSDIFGFRVIVASSDECYRALGVAHRTWRAVPGRFKDYISTPKQNDYQSLHTTVIGPHHRRVEMQIRTRDMNEIAERGVAAHALYKDVRRVEDAVNGCAGPIGRIQRLSLAAASGRDAVGRRKPARVPGAYATRAVPGPGLLLHAQGAAHRAAEGRHADRFRLCGPYERRRQLRRVPHQWPSCAARHPARQWR